MRKNWRPPLKFHENRDILPHGALGKSRYPESAEGWVSDLVGPALVRLKEMLEDDSLPPAVLLRAIAEILDRTGYVEDHRPSIEQIERWIDELIAEEEARIETNRSPSS